MDNADDLYSSFLKYVESITIISILYIPNNVLFFKKTHLKATTLNLLLLICHAFLISIHLFSIVFIYAFFTEEKTPGNYTFKFDSSILKIINLTKIDGNANSLIFVILCYM